MIFAEILKRFGHVHNNHEEDISYTLRSENASSYQWKIHGILFKVLDGDNEPSNFQEILLNLTHYYQLKQKRIPVKLTFMFPVFLNISINSSFRLLQNKRVRYN